MTDSPLNFSFSIGGNSGKLTHDDVKALAQSFVDTLASSGVNVTDANLSTSTAEILTPTAAPEPAPADESAPADAAAADESTEPA